MGRDSDRRDLSTAEVAALLGVATNTVRNWHERGELPAVRLPDPPGRRGNMRFPWPAVVALAESLGRDVVHPDDSAPPTGV